MNVPSAPLLVNDVHSALNPMRVARLLEPRRHAVVHGFDFARGFVRR